LRGHADAAAPRWLSYLEVDDVDQMVAVVQRHGGKVVRPPFDVPNFGRIAIGADPTGAFMAWVTPKADCFWVYADAALSRYAARSAGCLDLGVNCR
jgi:hypothetical protein